MQKCVYPYEYMDKKSLPDKKDDFYSDLNMEDVTDADYAHTKGVCKDFEIKNLRSVSWFVCSCKITFSSWISMASIFKKDENKTRPFNWYRYVINGRKRL